MPRANWIPCALCAFALCAAAHACRAQDVAGVFGADHTAAPGAITTESAFAALVGQRGAWEGHALAGRYDDSSTGVGTALGFGLGGRVARSVVLRVVASGSLGDHGDKALRLRAGPRLDLDRTTLVLDATRISDNSGRVAHGAIVEGERKLTSKWSLRANGSLARVNTGETLAAAAIGGAWSPSNSVVLSLEGGYAQNASLGGATNAPGGRGGPLGPLLGGNPTSGSQETSADAAGTTLALGVRFVLPQ